MTAVELAGTSGHSKGEEQEKRNGEGWLEMAQAAGYEPERFAALAGVSLRTMQRYFKGYNLRLSSWLKELRISEAYHRLKGGERVKEVAFGLRYSQLSQFSREFKMRFGVPPSEFSKTCSGGHLHSLLPGREKKMNGPGKVHSNSDVSKAAEQRAGDQKREMIPIVLVDDQYDDLLLLKRVLNRCKILNPIHLLSSGKECIAFYEGVICHSPSILFLDLMMHPLHGDAVLGELSKKKLLKETIVVMLSGFTDIRHVNAGYKLGAKTFLVKPISSEDVLNMLGYLREIEVKQTDQGYVLCLAGRVESDAAGIRAESSANC